MCHGFGGDDAFPWFDTVTDNDCTVFGQHANRRRTDEVICIGDNDDLILNDVCRFFYCEVSKG